MLVTTFLLFSLPPAPTAPITPIAPTIARAACTSHHRPCGSHLPPLPVRLAPPTIARADRTSHNSYFSPPLSPSHFANSLIIPTFALCKEYSP